MNSEWQDVGASSFAPPAREGANATAGDAPRAVASGTCSVTVFLEYHGLGKFAEKIIEVTDAVTVEDLKLLDDALLTEVIAAAELKLISAKKLRLAVAELRGEAVAPSSPTASPGSEAMIAAGKSSTASVSPNAVEGAKEAAPAMPQECVAICIDRSGSMGSPFRELTLNVVKGESKDPIAQRTRMEAVKVMFYAFRDRVESVGNGRHELGLIQFDDKVERMLDVTARLDLFETIVDDIEKRGQTAIYSSIIEAVQMLQNRFHEDSQTDLRIVALTDGQNNTGAGPEEALEAANRIGAVVDAIIVGDRPDANLCKIVNATGGECYQINDLGEGFELLEAEGVVSLRARRGGADKPRFERRGPVDFGTLSEKGLTRGTAVQRAPALAQDHVRQAVVDVASCVKSAPTTGSASAKRVLKELEQVASKAGEGVHVFPAPGALNFWRVLIEGPPDSPFEGGVFALSVEIPESYPFQPPKITFETPIYHCSVSDSGKICLAILHDQWSPGNSVSKCLDEIRGMMKDADTDMSLRQWIAELTLAHRKSNGTDTRYYDQARESTRQEASMTIADWRQKWGC